MDYIRAKINFHLSAIYSAHKSSNHKFSRNHKITCTNIEHKILEELVPSVLPSSEKAHKARSMSYDYSVTPIGVFLVY